MGALGSGLDLSGADGLLQGSFRVLMQESSIIYYLLPSSFMGSVSFVPAGNRNRQNG
jgi:hypothetical protein